MEKELNKTYKKLLSSVRGGGKDVIKKNNHIFLAKGRLFQEIIKNMPPRLEYDKAEVPLETLYDAGYHTKTGGMFVCNKGAYLLARTVKTEKYYATAHVGFAVFIPDHGIEEVDVGIAGDLTGDFIILRPESACSPSFIMGSQRCNCFDQWTLIRELAAHYNPIKLPKRTSPDELEEYVAHYFTPNEMNVPIPKKKGLGFLMIHMSSQNGMGSGANANEFIEDLTTTAFIRHRGEYSAEQLHNVSLTGGLIALGLVPDPRKLNNYAGFKIPSVILDYFNIHKKIIALTNNRDKIETLKKLKFNIVRIQSVGRCDVANGVETRDRIKELLHNIPVTFKTTFKEDFVRVNRQIKKICGTSSKKK